MDIIQFEDKFLAHYAYALISDGEIALVDPARNPQPYYDLAEKEGAKITAIIETHPHADFVSSHKEIAEKTGAKIYVSKLLGAEYEHHSFDDGDTIKVGKTTLKALNTPGHSPDSISVVVLDENGKEKAVFTGDTLFIGDCGRPDLRETAGALTATRQELARQMYHSLRDKLMPLPDDVLVYPAHGAGSLCGKGLSTANVSTIGAEKASNWSLKNITLQEFEHEILENQPFVPKYFTNSVTLNKKGAPGYLSSIEGIVIHESLPENLDDAVIIDTRDQEDFKRGHLSKSINLMNDTKFETWLGSIVSPEEKFYLIGENKEALKSLISRTASIGYEGQVAGAFVTKNIAGETEEQVNLEAFKAHPENYTIVDIRNASEVKSKKVFENALNIPLPELRERVGEVPTGKPIIVHCAGGYRSAAGASIIKGQLNGEAEVMDLSYAIKDF